jgi:hypothetical protein
MRNPRDSSSSGSQRRTQRGRPTPSTVEECLNAHAEFIETLGRLPIGQLDRFKALIEQDLGRAVFTDRWEKPAPSPHGGDLTPSFCKP